MGLCDYEQLYLLFRIFEMLLYKDKAKILLLTLNCGG